jgi:hypothetical protein
MLERRQRVTILAPALIVAAGVCCAWRGRALWLSTGQFRAWPTDQRVRYEPGAEIMAAEVAATLPGAIRTVEGRQYRAFVRAPAVYVCASVATYASYGGDPRSGGFVLNQRLFISPKPANTAERIPRLVAHELSHLQIEQQVGMLHFLRAYPPWFTEGFAAFISDGGGAEGVSDDEARRAIATGRALVPETTSSLFQRKSAHSYGLDSHLFYREGALFLADVHDRDAARFRQFLLSVEDGHALDDAFEGAFAETLSAAWARFVTACRAASLGEGAGDNGESGTEGAVGARRARVG